MNEIELVSESIIKIEKEALLLSYDCNMNEKDVLAGDPWSLEVKAEIKSDEKELQKSDGHSEILIKAEEDMLTDDLRLSYIKQETKSDEPVLDSNQRHSAPMLAKLLLEDGLRALEQVLLPTPAANAAAKPKDPPPPRRQQQQPLAPPHAPAPPGSLNACVGRHSQLYGLLQHQRSERVYRCYLCPGGAATAAPAVPGAVVAPLFRSMAELCAHKKLHHRDWQLRRCSLCPARFNRASLLGDHMRREHYGEPVHTCEHCPKAFFKLADLRTHQNVHQGNHRNVSETCDLRSHQNMHLSNQKSVSETCNLRTHQNIHLVNHKNVSETCDLRTHQNMHLSNHKNVSETDLRTHQNMHLSNQKSVSETCEQRTHQNVRRNPQGRRYFVELSPMLQHRTTQEETRSVACPACCRLHKTDAVMRMHGAFAPPGEAGPASAEESSPPPSAPRQRRFYCAACGDSFETAALLRQHVCQQALAVASTDYWSAVAAGALPCGGCGRVCGSVEELRSHSCPSPAARAAAASANLPLGAPRSTPPPQTPQPSSQSPPPPPQLSSPSSPLRLLTSSPRTFSAFPGGDGVVIAAVILPRSQILRSTRK